eukprot:CAMPEP_0195517568 /NCGR_PEP_ID=MMETSP0794_2-20130614/11011_1 /TAXON_ID=515487 /ORGANISM="Stephanopyxis turris, Strain CCMP 815" /LENGTH=414 /DNA_ID=CAMNT_0040646389 /DNA_START=254 /DNA_END=1498 /DNA_ORIENTATION=-
MYEEAESSPSSSSSSSSIVWSSLASTEKWIQETLARSQSPASPESVTKPYSRKTLSYVCETSESMEEIVGGVFRRLREVREIGMGHGKAEEELRIVQGSSYKPSTYRQTMVIVIPANDELVSSFSLFDMVVQAINNARRSARDFVTDLSLEKIDNDEVEWVTSVNLAHLHPVYGDDTSAKEENDDDEDYKAYKEARNLARRSPFPSLVLEVRSMPPIFPEEVKKEAKAAAAPNHPPESDDVPVTKEEVKKLEALFGSSANHKFEEEDGNDDDFYDAIGKAKGISQLLSPTDMAMNWVTANDPLFDASKTSFTSYDTKHVDAAYEFVFSIIAMQRKQNTTNLVSGESKVNRQYLIMPNFLSKSATSFEKFTKEIEKIIQIIPHLDNDLSVSYFHNEHVEKDRRLPCPALLLEWNK